MSVCGFCIPSGTFFINQPFSGLRINSHFRSRSSLSTSYSRSTCITLVTLITFSTIYDTIRFSIVKCYLESTSNRFYTLHPITSIYKFLQISDASLISINLCLQIVNVIIVVFTAYIGDSRKCQRPEEHHFYKFSFHNYLKITLIIYD